ncbi:MAG: anaerobic nitric oxide reductase flavorubredoxin [Candidatus Aminicenantes bacterium]|nr:anaerobic nitric oxide reductase flavorubredoxin [Candidatus Aminicenantes bacterium]
MKRDVKNNISWVGKVDWELRSFHGHELSTHRGSSYNAYLIREEKTVLIDTVWAPFAEEFVRGLEEEVPLPKIDAVVADHGEIDHSGALTELLRRIPDTPVYCSANAVKSLRGQFHQDWNFQVVKTGDRLSLGAKELVFVEAPMLHWPDSMMCYLTGDGVLFSNDAFGQHYATELLFNDLVDQSELFAEALKYYANILAPFSPLVTKKIQELLSMNLPLNMICPSHGVIWRENPAQIVEAYGRWAAAYKENQVTIVYDTMWDGTRRLAEAVARGINEAAPDVRIKLHNTSLADKNDIITDLFISRAAVFGSPTINRGILTSLAGLLEEVKGLKLPAKKAAAFGCYGWSGESVAILNDRLRQAGFEVVDEGFRALWNPDDKALQSARAFGARLAAAL